MDIKTKKIKAMVLAELLFAVFFCGIIMLLSISMFKSADVTKTPHLYSMMKNLPLINKSVMDDCYRDGACSTQTLLPDDLGEYCTRLSNNIVSSGETACDKNAPSEVMSGKTYKKNLTFASGVRLYDMFSDDNVDDNGKWKNDYIDVYITVGNKKISERELGLDIFPLRIFRNGVVIPGLYPNDVNMPVQAYDDEDFFSYRTILNKANISNDRYSREITTVAVHDDNKIRSQFSFREAVCRANRKAGSDENIMAYYYPDETSITCGDDYTLAPACDFTLTTNPNYNDHSAFCTVEAIRPIGSGILKIFGI